MHSFSDTTTGVPAFLAKLWRLVEDPATNNLIYWQSDGQSFVIQNQAQFARELLPQNYKHNNMASFIRQLNMYGFHKIASMDNGGLKFDKDEMEFSHPFFQRGNSYLLEHIKRKIATTKQVPEDKASLKQETVNKVMNEVRVVRDQQESLDNRFTVMKQENESLWREVAVLRQKHLKQQQIVNKLIQFLVTLVQPNRSSAGINTVNGVKRRFQLMIDEGPESSKKHKNSRNSGPVIHELTEDLLDDCDYDYETPIGSPTILSPAAPTCNETSADDISSPANFKIEDTVHIVDHPDLNLDVQTLKNEPGQFYQPKDEVSHVVNKLPDEYKWAPISSTSKQPQQAAQQPVRKYVIKYLKPGSKVKTSTKTATKSTSVAKSPTQGTTLLNSQQLNKKRPQLVLKMNKPMHSDGKKIHSVVERGKVVLAKAPTSSTSVSKNSYNVQPLTAGRKSYTNKSDFIESDMPNELFESQECSNSSKDDLNVACGSYNPTLSDDYTKKLFPTSSKNLTVAKYNNYKQDNENVQLKTPEDVNKQLDNIQGDLDTLKELFQNDNDYLLDGNPLFGNQSGSPSAKNRIVLSPTVDNELLLKIFGDLETPFGLSLSSDFPTDKRDDCGAAGSELISYQPCNSFDLSEMIGTDTSLTDFVDQQNGNNEDAPLLNEPELHTPQIGRKTISLNANHINAAVKWENRI